ncbi:hypothetical protein [Streptomyces parvus]|uniref:hypothetical protein n=1 Tax=Streptomyces parvus TaxID=66428 RepID=UPI003722A71C
MSELSETVTATADPKGGPGGERGRGTVGPRIRFLPPTGRAEPGGGRFEGWSEPGTEIREARLRALRC